MKNIKLKNNFGTVEKTQQIVADFFKLKNDFFLKYNEILDKNPSFKEKKLSTGLRTNDVAFHFENNIKVFTSFVFQHRPYINDIFLDDRLNICLSFYVNSKDNATCTLEDYNDILSIENDQESLALFRDVFDASKFPFDMEERKKIHKSGMDHFISASTLFENVLNMKAKQKDIIARLREKISFIGRY